MAYHKKNIPKYLERNAKKAKAAAEKKAVRDAKKAELEEQKAKAAAEKKAVRDAKKAELEEQKAKAAAEKKAVMKAQREKEILRLQQWLGKELVGLDEVKVAERLRKYINTKQKEVLDQIIPLWMKNDEDNKAKVNELLMSLKGRLSLKKEHIVRYIRLKVYTEISLITPFSTDPHIGGIRERVHCIMKKRGDSYVIWGSSAPCTPPTKDEFIKKACMITKDMELAKRFAQDLYIS
eukprot:scaffold22165_cov145-Skeletonema_dohrnii-CCMP3373.AAC.1